MRRILVIAASVAAAVPLAALSMAGGAGASTSSQTFSCTGAAQTFTVPAGVTSLTVDAFGAEGGMSSTDQAGGNGGEAIATIAVTPGETLQVNVGCQPTGSDFADGGFNGGGAANDLPTPGGTGGGGGGASDVRQGGTALADRVVVAGGGGGGGTFDTAGGGVGGGTVGATAIPGMSADYNGGGGTQVAGGAGGFQGASGFDGVLGQGGISGVGGGPSGASGGGGGGGFYGGGGGSGTGTTATSAAGGGGSGFTPDGSGLTPGVQPGDGKVVITWTDPVAPTTTTTTTVPSNVAGNGAAVPVSANPGFTG